MLSISHVVRHEGDYASSTVSVMFVFVFVSLSCTFVSSYLYVCNAPGRKNVYAKSKIKRSKLVALDIIVVA